MTSSSSTSFLGLYPDLEEKLNYAAHLQREKEAASRKKPKPRRHIYYSQVRIRGNRFLVSLTFFVQFKEEVKADKKKSREEMEKELYELRRQQGMCIHNSSVDPSSHTYIRLEIQHEGVQRSDLRARCGVLSY